MKTLHTYSFDGDWSGLVAQLRDDDSLRVEYSSRIQGVRDGAVYRWTNTGLIAKLAADDELDPETEISEWIDRHDVDNAKLLKRGYVVE